MKKLAMVMMVLAAVTSSCTRCYTCSENGSGVNSFKVCEDHPDYENAKNSAKNGITFTDNLGQSYKCM